MHVTRSRSSEITKEVAIHDVAKRYSQSVNPRKDDAKT